MIIKNQIKDQLVYFTQLEMEKHLISQHAKRKKLKFNARLQESLKSSQNLQSIVLFFEADVVF